MSIGEGIAQSAGIHQILPVPGSVLWLVLGFREAEMNAIWAFPQDLTVPSHQLCLVRAPP